MEVRLQILTTYRGRKYKVGISLNTFETKRSDKAPRGASVAPGSSGVWVMLLQSSSFRIQLSSFSSSY